MGRVPVQKMKSKLEAFARQYIILKGNGKQAAIAAGWAPKSADVTASQLLRNPKVVALIAKFAAPIEKKHDISVQRTLDQLARHAFVDPRALYNSDGSLKNIAELDADTAACIHAYSQEGKKKRSVKLTNALHALELLCRFHKLFAEDRTPVDMGIRVIVVDAPRPPRLVGAGAAALPAPTNGNGHKNGHNGNGNGHKPPSDD